ncbi:MAG: 3-isopropylmalate dehydratase large subunit [Desulfobacterales bacterium]|nr:3-isopropylmalate dehydratase large subunit [Desulfobacterales bacterium]
MKHTIFEKIILSHSSEKEVKPGDIVEVSIDKVMIHDFFTPFCVNKFNEMGFKKVYDPERIVFINDHLVPATFPDDYRHHKITEEFAREHNIKNIHRHDGVCHQLMHEQGYVKPGEIVLGTDSHTVTYGALGILATGIGYTEMAAVLGTGKMWMKVAPTIKILINGELPKGVFSKDIILQVLSDLKSDGASYKILEFGGSTINNMSADSRFTLSNMSVEAGAKAGIIGVDSKTVDYLSEYYSEQEIEMINSDEGAEYEQVIEYKAEDIPPLVACPYNVDIVKPASELEDITIDQAFLGSCTNGRLEDLEIAAKILEGKKVNPNIRFYIVPASRDVYKNAVKKGYIEKLAQAGAIVNHPACSLCAGRSGGLLESGERIISSNNRNFLGRMGEDKVEIYLGSPATVAASCLEGKITDPGKYI